MKSQLSILGTTCGACKMLIEDVAHDVPGVQSCEVDFETGKTVIEHSDAFDEVAFKREIETLDPKYQVVLSSK